MDLVICAKSYDPITNTRLMSDVRYHEVCQYFQGGYTRPPQTCLRSLFVHGTQKPNKRWKLQQ